MNLTPTPKLKPQSTGTMGQSMLCYAKSLSCVLLFETPWTVAHQAPLSMGISIHEYWIGLPRPSPGNLPDPGIEPVSLRWLINTWKDAQHCLLLEKCKSNCNEISPHTSQNGHHQKSKNNKYWRGCREKGTLLYCWWECKLIQPLWETDGDYLKN